jgi:uncharacterized protein YciI
MKTRFIVLQEKGPSWNPTRPRRSQAQWNEHAAFMDKLTGKGFIILGGPLGEGDGEDVLLVINAANKETVLTILQDDPWIHSEILKVKAIHRWTIFLEATSD